MHLVIGHRRRSRLLATTIVALLTTTAGVSAQAQTDAVADPTPPPAETDVIVVTAQRRSQDAQTVPISMQVLTGDNLNDLGIKSTSDLGQFTPNVSIGLPSGVGNQPLISIRGIGLNDPSTNNAGPNGVYVDEVYLSSPSSQNFQMFDLQRVEVLKGPQGTLYGRNTSGGAINFVSAKPSDQFSAHLHAEYGSYDTVNVEGAIGGPLTDTVDGRIAFVGNYSNGYLKNSFLDKSYGTRNYGVRAMLQFKPDSSLKILFNVHGGQVDNPFPGYQHLGTFVPGTQFDLIPTQCSLAQTYGNECVDLLGYGHEGGFYDNAAQERNRLRVNSLGSYLRADYSPGDITFTSITAFEHLDKKDEEDADGTPNRLLEVPIGVRSNAVTQEFRASMTKGGFNWVAGLYYLHEDLRQNQPISLLLDGDRVFGDGAFDGVAAIQSSNSRQVTDSYAVFGQAEYNVTDRLKLIAGLRYTAERKTFRYTGDVRYQQGGLDNFGPQIPLANTRNKLNDSAVNYRVGLDYKLSQRILAYASVSSGFKSGVFNGSFLSFVPAEIERQLQPVLAEKVTAYEVGLKSSFFDGRLVANAALFYNDYRNMQVYVLVPPVPGGGGLPVNVLDNAKRAHTEGADLSFVGKPFSNLTLTAQFGILRTRLDEYAPDLAAGQADYSGNQLSYAPRFSSSIGGEYRLPIGDDSLNFQINGSYKSRQFFDISNNPYTTQPGYWIANARIAYAFSDDRFEVAGFVRNLTNKKYYVGKYDLTNPFGFIQGIVGVPRFFGVEFNARY